MFVVAIAAVLATAPLQEPAPPPQEAALRMFLDCPSYVCDLDFMRTEVNFVSYVRDRTDAQVHVLVTTQETGGGGTQYTFTFIGLGDLAGRADTLQYSSNATSTSDDRRRGIAQVLRLGLVRYAAATPLAARLEVRLRPGAGGPGGPGGAGGPGVGQHDPWNAWVFSIGANGNFNGETSSRSRYLSGRVSASRTTEAWRMEFGFNGSNNLSSFDLDSVTTFKSTTESYGANALVVKSAGAHWSYGLTGSGRQSTYSNLDLRLRASPSIEYNVYPYSESTRHQLTFRYSAGLEYSAYTDTTIFGEASETRPLHSLDVGLSSRQPWGSVSVSATLSQYLHDTSKQRLETFGNMSVRLFRGLSLNWYGGYSVIRDQLSLPAAGATPEEILRQVRQLATSYSYWGGFGLSFRFGSIFNNVVNPRFGGGGGDMIIFN